MGERPPSRLDVGPAADPAQQATRASRARAPERAGVSKQTVYGHFGGKESLFAAVVGAVRESAAPPADPGPILDPADLHGSLVRFVERMLVRTQDPQVAALRRLVIGELGTRPELRDLWNADGPSRLLDALAAELTALTAEGVLDVPDPRLAARQVVGLWTFEGNDRSRYGVDPLTAADRREIAEGVAGLVLRAYRR
ncbi:TetR/AcrR family transcriptional regulator [Pseudonocardia halophobica]|uniref:TetR/AcrR family transcriptional regulator n=1 Tax=Pseudonocardia halophobica TaxID=29401 RepID=UPI003D94CDB7